MEYIYNTDNKFLNYEFMFGNYPNPILVLDLKGDIIYANETATKFFCYTGDQLIKTSYRRIYMSEDSETFHYYFLKAIAGESNEFDFSIDHTGENRLELSVKTVPNKIKNQVISISVYMKDITEQKKVDYEILQTSKELCESFIENNQDPILLLDVEATIVLANRAFSRLLGWRKKNLEGFHILQCPSIPTHLVTQMRDYYHRVVTSNADSDLDSLETIRITNEGKEYQMLLSITPIYDHNDAVCNWAVHLRDITDKKILEVKLEYMALEQELSKLEHLKTVSQLAASISHEVRNPLTVTRGFIQLLKDNVLSEEKRNRYIQLSLQELDRAEKIITDYLTFAKPSLKDVELLDLSKELDYIIQVINPYASMKNIVVVIEKEEETVQILGESKKLHQSLINIIKNGIESMEQTGKLSITLKVLNNRALIIIEDTGKGMDSEQIKKLGTPYFTTKDKGTGLGSMVAFSILEAMHGNIEVESKKGKGTRFLISLPKYIPK